MKTIDAVSYPVKQGYERRVESERDELLIPSIEIGRPILKYEAHVVNGEEVEEPYYEHLRELEDLNAEIGGVSIQHEVDFIPILTTDQFNNAVYANHDRRRAPSVSKLQKEHRRLTKQLPVDLSKIIQRDIERADEKLAVMHEQRSVRAKRHWLEKLDDEIEASYDEYELEGKYKEMAPEYGLPIFTSLDPNHHRVMGRHYVGVKAKMRNTEHLIGYTIQKDTTLHQSEVWVREMLICAGLGKGLRGIDVGHDLFLPMVRTARRISNLIEGGETMPKVPAPNGVMLGEIEVRVVQIPESEYLVAE